MVTIHDHGQQEYLKRFAHACIDAGADAFFGAGPHRLSGIEIYKGKPVFYSLGNFLFQFLTVKRLPYEVYESTEMFRTMLPREKYEELAEEKIDPLRSDPGDFYKYIGSYFGDKEIYWTSVVPRIVFSDRKVKEIRLYPITLNPGASRGGPLGRPMLAEKEMAERILKRLQTLSRPYGTVIETQDGLGYIRVDRAKKKK
ncbi:MAG: CapA family protein [Candidatus Aminicenantales bacterium]